MKIKTVRMERYIYETLMVTSPHQYVVHVEINRPDKRNAMNAKFWRYVVDLI